MAHIWACPPLSGDGYIFHCHPAEQKSPTPKRLQEWFQTMLDKGIIDGIIVNYKDIFRHFVEDSVVCATELPYFKGDFWPYFLEMCLRDTGQLKLQETEQCQPLGNSPDTDGESENRKMKFTSGNGANVNNTLTQKILDTMEKHKAVSNVFLGLFGKTGSVHVRSNSVLSDRRLR